MATQLLILPIILLSSLTSFTTSYPTPSSPIPPIIVSTWTKTIYPDICYSSIQPYIRSVPHIDTTSILAMLVHAAKDYTKTTRKMASQINAEENDKGHCLLEADVIGECQKGYKDALESLESAMVAMRKVDKATANHMMSSAVKNYGSCQQGYLNLPKARRMVEHGELLAKMATICFDVLNLLYVGLQLNLL